MSLPSTVTFDLNISQEVKWCHFLQFCRTCLLHVTFSSQHREGFDSPRPLPSDSLVQDLWRTSPVPRESEGTAERREVGVKSPFLHTLCVKKKLLKHYRSPEFFLKSQPSMTFPLVLMAPKPEVWLPSPQWVTAQWP